MIKDNWLSRIFSHPICNWDKFRWQNTPLKSMKELEKEAEEILNNREYFIDYGEGDIKKVTEKEYKDIVFECALMFDKSESYETPKSSTFYYYNRIID